MGPEGCPPLCGDPQSQGARLEPGLQPRGRCHSGLWYACFNKFVSLNVCAGLDTICNQLSSGWLVLGTSCGKLVLVHCCPPCVSGASLSTWSCFWWPSFWQILELSIPKTAGNNEPHVFTHRVCISSFHELVAPYLEASDICHMFFYVLL